MTYEEALNTLRDFIGCLVPARATILEYRRFEAFDKAIEALEKQIPKKPYVESAIDDWCFACPVCGNQDIHYLEHHCPCGQLLLWEDYE